MKKVPQTLRENTEDSSGIVWPSSGSRRVEWSNESSLVVMKTSLQHRVSEKVGRRFCVRAAYCTYSTLPRDEHQRAEGLRTERLPRALRAFIVT